MSNIKDGGVSYTIPVDSLDIEHLSKHVSSTGILPLWTKSRLNGEGGYCEVQILAQNDEECYSERTDTYECHICNVQVPVTCSKEHNDSDQHKTFKNITQKVLEKLSKQIDMSIDNHDEKMDTDAYYCVPCSKIIKKENKDKHESTEFHAKSNKDKIIVNEFYKIINEDKSRTDDIIVIQERLTQDSNLEPVNTKSCIENNNYAVTINKLNNYSDNGDDDLPIYANVTPGPSKNGNKIQPPYDATPGPSKNGNKIQPPCDAIPGRSKNGNKSQPPNDATPGPSKNYNKIQLPNDEKAETFEEYLEAMIKKYKLKVNLPVMTSGDIYLESSNGDTVIVSPEHFQSYKKLKNSVYCQLCKMWISQDTKPHDVTENHVKNIFKPINENFARTIDSVSSHCVPCNYVVLTNSAQHTLDDYHRKIVKDTCFQKVHDVNGIMVQHSIIKTENPNVFFCKLCKLTVSKYALTNHVVVGTHLIKKTNDASKINKKNTTLAEYCTTCKVGVPFGGMQIHVDGKAHKNQINQLNENDIKSEENNAQNSNTSSTNTSTTKIDSIASTSTSSSISNAEIQNDLFDARIEECYELLEFADDSQTEVRCKICMVYIAFDERLIIGHMESIIHVENKQKLDEYYKLLCYTDNAKRMVNCEICCVSIPKVDSIIIEHMEGRNHETAVTWLLKFNFVTKESSCYLCECCNVHMTDYLQHIKSKSHTITFLQKYNVDKITMRKYVYESDDNDVIARGYRVQYRNLLKHSGIYKLKDTSYYCGICQIEMGRISELDHMLGERHALKLAEIEDL